MPKFYVESGDIQIVVDAETAHDAAVCAFHTLCERQAEAMISSSAESNDDLKDTIRVNERGFGRLDGDVFNTLDVLAAWQGCAFPWGLAA